MTTQKADVLSYIRTHGGITRMESFTQLGVCELSSRIGELERDGHRFHRQPVIGKAVNGRRYRVVRYSLDMMGGTGRGDAVQVPASPFPAPRPVT